MTLESLINRNRYVGNGTTRVFPFSFRVWKPDQVQVTVGDGAAETDVTAVCTITLTSTGGSVAFPSAPEEGKVVVLQRKMPFLQEDDYRNGSRFDAEEIEDRLDQDCAERQDLLHELEGVVRVPKTSSKTPEDFWRDIKQWRDDVVDAISGGEGIAGETLVTARHSTEPRELQDRFADAVNAADFGAKGDGVTDDTLALQDAINAALLRKRPLVLNGGTYVISQGLVVEPQEPTPHRSEIVSVVPGPMNAAFSHAETLTVLAYGGARIVAGAAMDYMIKVQNSSSVTGAVEPQNIRVVDLILDGNSQASVGIYLLWTYRNAFYRVRMFQVSKGFYLDHSAVNLFEHCILSCSSICIDMHISGDNKIFACDFYPQAVGIACGGGDNTQIDDCLFTGEVFSPNVIMKGVELFQYRENRTYAQTINVVVQNCEFVGLDYAIYGIGELDGQTSNDPHIWNVIFKGNHTVRSSYKPSIRFLYIENAVGVIVSNNSCGGLGGAATENIEIQLKDCLYGVISGNTFIRHKEMVIALSNSSCVNIVNNTFLDAVETDDGLKALVYVDGNYNIVKNNIAKNQNTSATFCHVFASEATGGHVGNVFEGNCLGQNFTRPYESYSYDSYARRVDFKTAAPSSGYWTAGDIVWNRTPESGGAACWICTASGTPGTWVALTLN